MTLSTTQKTIEELLTGNRQYQIPDFQRPYVWEEQQAIALVNDLLDAWRTNDGDYFLGSIVLVDHPGGDNVDVIDGQQRLTTLCAPETPGRHRRWLTRRNRTAPEHPRVTNQRSGRKASPLRPRVRPPLLRHLHRR